MYAELERMCERFIDGEEVVHNCYRWSGMTLRCIGATLMLDYERNRERESSPASAPTGKYLWLFRWVTLLTGKSIITV